MIMFVLSVARATRVDARALTCARRAGAVERFGAFPIAVGSNAAPESAEDDADERATDEGVNFAIVQIVKPNGAAVTSFEETVAQVRADIRRRDG
jgi:hypothetical protein